MIRDWLTARLLIPFADRFQGDHRSMFVAEITALNQQNLETIRKFQLKRLRFICDYVYRHTSLYRQRFDDAGLRSFETMSFEDFARLQPLTKADIRGRLSELISDQFQVSQLRRTATGGTTSSPTAFYMDWETFYKRWAASIVHDKWMNRFRGHRLAFFWGAPQDFPSTATLRSRVKSFLSNTIFLHATPLDDKILLQHFKRLKKFEPMHLQAYATPLSILANFMLERGLSLTIPSISVTAEPIAQESVGKIEVAFGSRPFNWYGARELGRLATECVQRNGMHMNCYAHYVEVGDVTRFGDGANGQAMITDLWNVGMPLLRYEIGDVISVTNEKCRCGSELPRIKSVLGRVADTFVNSKGQRIPGVVLPNRILTNSDEISEVQFIQTGLGEFEVLVTPGQHWTDASADRLISRLSEFMMESVRAEIKLVNEIPREASGKVRFCKCLI